MTAPKKPRSASAMQAPPAKLTTDQLRVAHLFASMNDEAQADTLAIIAAWAAAFPRRAPALRLVVGGVK